MRTLGIPAPPPCEHANKTCYRLEDADALRYLCRDCGRYDDLPEPTVLHAYMRREDLDAFGRARRVLRPTRYRRRRAITRRRAA